MKKWILIAEDDVSMGCLLRETLENDGYDVACFNDPNELIKSFPENEFDAAIVDINMPGINGIDLCKFLVSRRSSLPVIIITAFGDMDSVIASIRAGAYNFINKPVDMDFLLFSVKQAIDHHDLQEKVKLLNRELTQVRELDEIVGNTETISALKDQIRQISDINTSVLITGETGTGKGLIAQTLHNNSSRKNDPFIVVNCAAIPENLLESELFGYVKGSFTDAKSDKKGLFIQAHSGTLFLDEIGDLPLNIQPKLLRAIDERKIRPIGAKEEFPINIRIISATNKNLEDETRKGKFREDLYYRINVIQIKIPPLRERASDIIVLIKHFIEIFSEQFHKRINGIINPALKKLLEYPWPGNIREVRNAIEHSIALARHDKITTDDLPDKIRNYKTSNFLIKSNTPEQLMTLDQMDEQYIVHVINTVNGNQSLAAKILGIDRSTLYRKFRDIQNQDDSKD